MSDCRLGRGIEKIRRILQLGKTNSYNLYSNSTRGDRGVCIAIKRDRNVEILEEVRETVFENYLLLRCRVDQKEMLIGAVYGPNTNNVAFYRELIDRIEGYGLPTVIGGDWNTVLDDGRGAENLDLEDREHIPQKDNGKMLREWIERGDTVSHLDVNIPWPQKCHTYPLGLAGGWGMHGWQRITASPGLTFT